MDSIASFLPTLLLVGGIVVALVLLSAVLGGGKDAYGTFARTPLLNATERKLAGVLERAARDTFGPTTRLLAQVSYGEFVKGGDRSAQARINQKRADFVLVDGAFEVLCVVEYQGRGHHGSSREDRADAEHRDKVKRAACASAGIPLVEVPPKFDAGSVAKLLAAVRR